MKLLKSGAIAAGLIAFLMADAVGAASYKTTLLHPLNGYSKSRAESVSAGNQVGYAWASGAGSHAALWQGSAESFVDLNPVGFGVSEATGTSGDIQVGYGGSGFRGAPVHALLWNSTAANFVDLNPPGFVDSEALAVSDGHEVGYGIGISTSYDEHALLWAGTAASFLDLNPAGFSSSHANGLSEDIQVGSGEIGGNDHALLWTGSAASAVDLNPIGFISSIAKGVSGYAEVGYGVSDKFTGRHALLWHGTADNLIDLNPNGFIESAAFGVSGGNQVGGGSGTATGGKDHALLWNGSAQSAVDLHSFLASLPLSFDSSFAIGIDSTGTIVGQANVSTFGYAVMWTPVPEPSSWALLCCSAVGLAIIARRERG